MSQGDPASWHTSTSPLSGKCKHKPRAEACNLALVNSYGRPHAHDPSRICKLLTGDFNFFGCCN
eukprot:441649-Pelagomonas_calceolata.AAC.2